MQIKKIYLLFSLLLCMPVISFAATEEGRLLRFPATNGETVVFSYAGDLYSVPISGGMARRLTSHIGYEMFPRFSPDGKTIAFTGQYDGNTEVFAMPSEGGEPLRLTYTATLSRDDIGDRMGPNNIVITWTPEGKVVYRSRQRTGGSFTGHLYTVAKEGGLSDILPLPEGGFCSYSPDGKQLAYNRVMREFRTWKYYQGGMADDIWIYDFTTRQVENISNNNAQDIIPMWIGNKIYYLSDRDRVMNLFSYNIQTKETRKETDFKTYDIKFPSSHGNLIVFENGGYIYKFDSATGKTEKIDVTLISDNTYARSEVKDGKDYITLFSPSPNGERLAVTARGEVFDVPVSGGVTKNITRTPGAHERRAKWSYDGKWIVYISDRTGETELYLQSVEGGEPEQITSDNDTYITDVLWSPDSKTLVYLDRKNRVISLDITSRKKKVLVEDPNGLPGNVSFSADGKWLTYTRSASNDMSVIYAYDMAAGKEYPLTEKWYSSHSPRFSNDGKYIIFTSARDFNPTYGSTEWNHVYNNMNGVYLVLLSQDTPSPFLESDAVLGEKKTESADTTSGIRIDLEGITDRIVKLPLSPSYYSGFFGIDDKIYYHRGGSVYMYNLKDKTERLIVEGGYMDLTPNNKKALINKGGNIYIIDIPSGPSNLERPVDLSDMKITTDYSQEWAQIFDEAWRHMRDGFYLSNMHGVDWSAMKKKYEVLLPYVKHRLDLNYVIGEMIGELNCGHAYFNPGEVIRADRSKLGLLGAEISRDKSGYFRIDKILKGASYSAALRSPLTENGLDVKEGLYITAIDGVDVSSVKDLYSLLVGKANVPTEIALNNTPSSEGARKIVIRPISDESALYHYEWVQRNIRKVEEASGGRIGYVYIPDMGVDGLNEFARYFYPQLDKEGLIIDDRANGGGNVSPMILERLSREPYRVTMSRNSVRTHLIPDGTLYGPKVCLINKYSASDGDLFPWGFRALGLGKLIGTRTWGGIVGISGSLPFIDGSDLRVPFFTSYSFKDGQWIIENHGVDPDIVVDNDPAREWDGEDQQLDAAIEEVMKQLKDRKPVPPVPSPRDFSK